MRSRVRMLGQLAVKKEVVDKLHRAVEMHQKGYHQYKAH